MLHKSHRFMVASITFTHMTDLYYMTHARRISGDTNRDF